MLSPASLGSGIWLVDTRYLDAKPCDRTLRDCGQVLEMKYYILKVFLLSGNITLCGRASAPAQQYH
jgi:hypothetical protein